ncbi:MAG: TRAP transporter small permease [Pseudomonadota bacterium]
MANGIGEFHRKTEKVSWAMSLIGSLSLGVIIIVITLSTGRRFFAGKDLFAAVNIAELLIVITTFFGLAWTQVKGLHVDCGVIFEHLPIKSRRVINVFVFIVNIFFAIILFWAGLETAIQAYGSGETAFVSGELLTIWPFKWFVPVGVVLYIGILLFQLKDSIVTFLKREGR